VPDNLSLVPEAYALRLCRTLKDRFRLYDPVTFPADPCAGCRTYLRRCQALGYMAPDSPFVVDVLDENGDIVQDYRLTREGFNWLKRVLNTKVEGGDDD
jgi:hypothetical protein